MAYWGGARSACGGGWFCGRPGRSWWPGTSGATGKGCASYKWVRDGRPCFILLACKSVRCGCVGDACEPSRSNKTHSKHVINFHAAEPMHPRRACPLTWYIPRATMVYIIFLRVEHNCYVYATVLSCVNAAHCTVGGSTCLSGTRLMFAVFR